MASSQLSHLRDEHGNPVELTDEHGHPVKLTDERGHPIHLSGVAYTDEHGNPVDTRGLHSTANRGGVGHDNLTGTGTRGVHSTTTTHGSVVHDNLTGTRGTTGTYGGTHGLQSSTTHSGVGHDSSTATHGMHSTTTHAGVGHENPIMASGGTHPSATQQGGGVLPKNPLASGIQSSTLGGAAHGTHETGHHSPAGTLGDVLGGRSEGAQHQPRREIGGTTAAGIVSKEIRRSGSSSGDSSEEEGHTPTGERRKKKGLGEKIKDKIMPGGKHKDQDIDHTATTTVATTTTTTVQHHEDEPAEKKGLMDKIKDKLPGHH